MADTLLGIETDCLVLGCDSRDCFTLTDALLGIEASFQGIDTARFSVSLWLMPF